MLKIGRDFKSIWLLIIGCVIFPHSSLDLQQRLEYLSRAVISAKSASYNRADTSEGDLLHDLEEKLDVSL